MDHVPGVRSHYLPASYLGGFSLQSQGKLRERPVCVLRRNDGGPFVTKAEGIGWKRGLDIEPDDPTRDGFKSFEEVWGSYESLLPEAICELVGSAGSMAAELWLLALVPFVGGLFARGPDFERHVRQRHRLFQEAGIPLDDEPISRSRLFELHRMLPLVMACRWRVLHTSEQHPLVTNDLGYAPYVPAGWHAGVVVPLNRLAAVALTLQPKRVILLQQGLHEWATPVDHVEMQPQEVREVNERMAQVSQEFIVADTQAHTLQLRSAIQKPLQLNPDNVGGLLGYTRPEFVYDWARAVTLLKFSPLDYRVASFEIDVQFLLSKTLLIPPLSINGDAMTRGSSGGNVFGARGGLYQQGTHIGLTLVRDDPALERLRLRIRLPNGEWLT